MSRRQRRGRPRGGPALLAAAVAVPLAGVPLLRLAQVGGLSGLRAWLAPGTGTLAWHTVALAAVVTTAAVPLGAATALALARPALPWRRTLRVLALAPLLIPQFVLGFAWTTAYGRAGLVDQAVGVAWGGLLGPVGVAVVLVVTAAPVAFLVTAAALAARGQPELEQAARCCGAGPARALVSVTLPLLRPALAAAAALTFAATLESFAVPQVLGAPAGFATVTTRIYGDIALGAAPAQFRQAVGLALGLAVAVAVVLAPADLLLGPRLAVRRTTGPAPPPAARRRGPGDRVLAVAVAGYLAVAVAVPALALLATAATRAVGLPPTPGNWTLANFRGLLTPATGAELGHSLLLAAGAASALTLLAAATAAGRRRGGRLLTTVATVTFAVPGSALAVGLLAAYGRWLDGSLTLILLAYLAKMWALAARPVAAAADRLADGEAHAARLSGAGPWTAARTAVLPALAPALLAGWLLVFLSALHEVTMSSLLYGAGSETLAVAVLDSQQLGDLGATAALSVLLTALVALAALPAWALLRWQRRWTGAPAGPRPAPWRAGPAGSGAR